MIRVQLCVTLLFAISMPGLQADEIDELAKKTLGDKMKPGVALVVGILRDGKTEVRGYGQVATAKPDQTPDGDTIFEIGSITKTFTGVLLAEAIRRKEMSLDEPLQKYLPADLILPKPKGKPPTVLDFATHRSGLPVQPPGLVLLVQNAKNPYASFDRALLIKTLALTETKVAGDKPIYSNLATGLLGHALVHVAKADSYEALVRERITKPLKMRDTTEALTGEQRSRLALPHDVDGEPTEPWDFASLEACGCLRSSMNDMLRYAAANLKDGDDELTQSLTHARKPQREDSLGQSVGFYWVTMQNTKTMQTIVWHNGGTGGYRSMLVLYPQRKIAVVVLTNADLGPKIDKLALHIVTTLATNK